MTLKDGYEFGGFSGTPPSEPNLSTPPPPPRDWMTCIYNFSKVRGNIGVWPYEWKVHSPQTNMLKISQIHGNSKFHKFIELIIKVSIRAQWKQIVSHGSARYHVLVLDGKLKVKLSLASPTGILWNKFHEQKAENISYKVWRKRKLLICKIHTYMYSGDYSQLCL